MLCRICVVQVQPKKHVLGRAGYTAPTLQHELDHTDQECICALIDLDQVGIDYLSVRRVQL